MSRNQLNRQAISVGLAFATFSCAAAAQEADSVKNWEEDERGWDFFIGAGVERSAEYEGSDKYKTSAFPGFQAVWNDRFLISPGGIGAFLVQEENYSLFAGLGYGGGRKESDSTYLRGLGDIEDGAVFSLGRAV